MNGGSIFPFEEDVLVESFPSSSQKSFLEDVNEKRGWRLQGLFKGREGVPQGAVSGPPTSSEGSLKKSFQFWDDVEIPGGEN